ncbi:MAG: septum formation protein Maf [Gemmatimonadetes bacterium]|nr:septum formation protein Maf [Gemmatimonadota bacterium]NNF13531.1 septum formation protein Maf [Gemmatimonadota bacterium]
MRGGPQIVLASASPRRLDVLRQLGVEPVLAPVGVDESYLEGESPEKYVERLARTKAEAVVAERGALVVGGDTVVLDGDEVLGKPADRDAAVSMLMSLSGGTHEVLSALAVSYHGGVESGVARTVVRMRSFGEMTAGAYVATGEPMDKAGGYGIQGLGAALVAEIEGDYYSVVGFPVGLFLDLLGRVGWQYAFGSFTPVR